MVTDSREALEVVAGEISVELVGARYTTEREAALMGLQHQQAEIDELVAYSDKQAEIIENQCQRVMKMDAEIDRLKQELASERADKHTYLASLTCEKGVAGGLRQERDKMKEAIKLALEYDLWAVMRKCDVRKLEAAVGQEPTAFPPKGAHIYDKHQQELTELANDRDRLREALRVISEHEDYGGCYDGVADAFSNVREIARQALEEKE